MKSERIGTILGIVVAIAALAAAFIYVPVGSGNMAAKPAVTPPQAPTAAVTPAPVAPRGPVVREVPE